MVEDKDGFYVATRIINPILLKFRQFISKKYGLQVLKNPHKYSHVADVEIWLSIERLRDDLAFDKIRTEEFTNSILRIIASHKSLSPQVYAIVDEIFYAMQGCHIHQLTKESPTLLISSEVEKSLSNELQATEWGVCPICSKNGDVAEKPLMKCRYCGELYCKDHIEPRLVMTFSAYQLYIKEYRDIADVIKEHWRSERGHPCIKYTAIFWKTYHKLGGRGKIVTV
ncbi:hypothetical protein [Infirmifilum sp. NZ]|uniref:hypothetical protein n=1 Tax=Infirmifilum sp. NZ TaxID=2926850 RepID=UPI002798E0C6|nr:hypothetical protein [Infirmifilum sp. NZ]UNQ73585.1 hypothetical protein MOV14_00880 [Infirmifilum sp. NZ]